MRRITDSVNRLTRLLVSGQDLSERRAGQLVVEGQIRPARIPEDQLYPLGLQGLDDRLGAGDLPLLHEIPSAVCSCMASVHGGV